MSMSPEAPVLVELIYFNAGGGHRASALALEAAIARAGLPWRVCRTNLFEVFDPQARFRQWTGMDPEELYNKRLARGWTLGLTHELRLLQGMIRLSHERMVQALRHHWGEHHRPAMVVSLVPNFNRSMSDALERALPGTPFVTVMTDLADCPPSFWIEPQTSQIVVCGSPHSVQQARAAGVPQQRIWETSGMILGEQFYADVQQDRAAERVRMGLDAHSPVGLVLFGSEGSKEMLPIARRLTDTPLILACGRNAELAQALRALKRNAPTVVLDFTREMARIMRLADFFIGKPGSGSLSEAVLMGLPPIVVRNAWTMPQERFCTDWVRDNGLGLVLPHFKAIAPAVQTLLADLPRYQAATRRMHNRAAFEVPQVLAQILHNAGQQARQAEHQAA